MESRLVIFIGSVAVALVFNTLMLFMAYKAFAAMTVKLTKGVDEFKASGARASLTKLQTVSEEAAKATGALKEQVTAFEPALEKLQANYAESLSKADVRIELACRGIHFVAQKAEEILKWPVRNINASTAFVQGIIAFIRGSENGADARSRRTR